MNSLYMYGIISDGDTRREFKIVSHYIISSLDDITTYYNDISRKLDSIEKRYHLNNTNRYITNVDRAFYVRYYQTLK